MTEWLKIDEDAEINVVDIMQQIRAHLAETDRAYRPTDKGSEGPEIPREAAMALSAARAAADSTVVGLDFDPSPVPLLGPLIDRLRQAVHQLVVFYVNKSAKKQIVVNAHLISALDALAQELAEREEQQREIADLRRELQAVRDALAAPESR